MKDLDPPRIGVLRPTALHRVAAEAEARVIRHELERRVGPVSLDLRIAHFEPVGPWLPVTHASWPSSIDVLVTGDDLFGDHAPPLTALFARTVEPEAAAVRRRMLVHLGVAAEGAFDDGTLTALDEMTPTPTDLWLLVGAADDVSVSDDSVAGLGETSADAVATLDDLFDGVAERLRANESVAASIDRALDRTIAERDALRAEVAGLRREIERQRAEFADAIDASGAQRAATEVIGDPT